MKIFKRFEFPNEGKTLLKSLKLVVTKKSLTRKLVKKTLRTAVKVLRKLKMMMTL